MKFADDNENDAITVVTDKNDETLKTQKDNKIEYNKLNKK
jgi:hypothetical protein